MNIRLFCIRRFLVVQKFLSVLLIFSFVFGNLGNLFDGHLLPSVPTAEAAQVTIDPVSHLTGASHLHGTGQSVFISDQVGYKFYRDAPGYCVYRKTTNAGATWSATTTVDAQTDCLAISVWYDKWTPGGSGTFIHIVTIDSGNGDPWYNRLDTSNDTLLLGSAPVSTITGSAQGNNTFVALQNYPAITKGTDGTIYVAISDNVDSYIVECTVTCQTNTNWTETGTNPLDLLQDENLLVPLAGGDIMLINRSIAAANEDIRSKIWNNTTWSASWTMIDGNATDNTVYPVGMAATVSSSTAGRVYLAYIASNATLGTDDEIRSHYYNGTSWATSTKVLTGSTTIGITNVAIGLDTNNNAAYVAYTARATAATAATGRVWWKRSTDNMTTWSAATGPINTTPADFYGVDLNTSSNERMYASWAVTGTGLLAGDTIADPTPGVVVSSLGSQIATTSAPFVNKYIGGTYVITEKANARNVTSVTLSENGTINAATAVKNVKLFYENDITAPYDCASESYAGTESQFGSTATNGFSAADGTAVFSGSSIGVSTTSSMCLYTVLDVNDTVTSGNKLNVFINNPTSDIVVTKNGVTLPATSVDITGDTPVLNDNLTQIKYHWRNDNGTETTATSKTGGSEGISFGGYQRTPIRLRVEVSNAGGTTSAPVQYRLEDSIATTTCSAATQWVDVGAAGGAWDMFNSANITDGNDTTNIAVGNGGVTDANTTFKTPNAGVKDTSSQTANITLLSTQFAELEYSIVASSTVPDGKNYCFRLTKAGGLLDTYTVYPSIIVFGDINVTATSSQVASLNAPASNQYLGGTFAFTDQSGSHTITSVKLSETGTINAQTSLSKIRLKYDLDTTAPYNCVSESYAGTEPQFGATSTAGFSSANGTTTISGSLIASSTRAVCMYVVLDTTGSANNGETIDVEIANANTDVTLTSGTVSPGVTTALSGSTVINAAVMTQSRYHWRNFNGTQATATSLTNGIENTPALNIGQSVPLRLRMEVENKGTITSQNTALRLEYGAKITTCANVSSWTDVGASAGAFDMYNSVHLTDGANTTNIASSTGGLTDDNPTFKTPNAAVKDTSSQIATTTFTTSDFMESEFSIKALPTSAFNTTYCFRLSNAGTALKAYTAYPELTTSPERDFEIQRGTANFAGTSLTLFAGTDYVAPSASTTAFVRITNIGYTGAGDSSAGGTQNAKDVTAYISNASNILTSFTLTRPATAIATTTRVSWEIVEFIGKAGSDNEIKVRQQSSLTLSTVSLTATSTTVGGIVDDTDVVVFVTGQLDPDTLTTDYNTGLFTSKWLGASDQAAFQRGEASADASIVSYAVVEFTGVNWKIQRTEHTYVAAGATETNAITAVGSISQTFVHAQKRSGTNAQATNQYGHEVWLSSIGAVSFLLEAGSLLPTLQTSVAWIIENTQTTNGFMVVTRSNGNTTGGGNPLTLSVAIGVTLDDLTNASIFANARGALTTTVFPRPIAGVTISSSTAYEIWRSDTGAVLTYRAEVVQWPTAGLSFFQNDYLFYVDNNALDPTDPWPLGTSTNLGENAPLTATDEPLGNGEHIRIRMNLTVHNATMPALGSIFKLQYSPRITSCTAIADVNWTDVGVATSSAVWRAYDAPGIVDGTALSTDPPAGGALNLTVSDTAGTYEENNNTASNPYLANEDGNVEYDWHVQQNGANTDTFYCFRMVNVSGSALGSYLDYPQLRTSNFTPKTQNWRWYGDANNETPVTALAVENSAPANIANGSSTKLRITVKETENISQANNRFKLQYSEYSNFATVRDVVATSTCVATSTWCYFNGAGTDNVKITTKVLSDADPCSLSIGNGCGTHNESASVAVGFTHLNTAATEYEFSIIPKAPRVSAVYYFRLFDITQGIAVPLNTSMSYPSLVVAGASLVFNVTGLSAGSSAEDGEVLDVASTPTTIAFGTVPFNTQYTAGYRLNVNTDATEGYQVFMYSDQQLLNSYGGSIPPVTGTNAVPSGWSTGCIGGSIGCFGYHVGDDNLGTGNKARFGATDSYAALSTSPQEVMYSSVPINDTHDIVYKLQVSQTQPAGTYQARVTYIVVPVF